MSLPLLKLNITTTIYGFEEDGTLSNVYKPFQNLKIAGTQDGINDLTDLKVLANNAGIDISTPIYLDTEVSYDDSINLLVNDQINPLKIINSRFYVIDSNNYKIADRKGNLDTNIYTQNNFQVETSLIKSVNSIVSLTFEGIDAGGRLPVGSYHFYFKLADSDGNETDFVAESGKVVCHIGAINDPTSIRGGLLDENSDKLVKFSFGKLDLAYDYINVYYTRTTGEALTELSKTYKITDKFRINSQDTKITITGYENTEEIDNSEINIQYANFKSCDTVANCQNITFAGNVTKDYEIFGKLEKYSLHITPELSFDENIGNLTTNYDELYPDIESGYEYYNAKNIYKRLGYWNEEIYRLGIVYILNDYTLSPVFNIRGIKELSEGTSFKSFLISDDLNDSIEFGEDFLLQESLNVNNPENSKGVFKIVHNARTTENFDGKRSIKPIGIKLNFNSVIDERLKNITKGFFVVRQKRIPTILSQGLAIGTSQKTYTPMIKKLDGYIGECFLDGFGRLKNTINTITPASIINNALLCPEANLRTSIFNNFFNSSEFILKNAPFTSGLYFGSNTSKLYQFDYLNSQPTSSEESAFKANLLLVEPGIEIINNGDYKFSSKVGNPLEAWKHMDLIHGDINDLENSSFDPDNLSSSVTKIRGEFNTYIGTNINNLVFGNYYNIFQKDYNFSRDWKNYFRIRYNDSSPFIPISDRFAWESITNEKTIALYRGDCYINNYTHRMNWNFIDPELPTNTTIVDPYTWYKNYKVQKTKIKGIGSLFVEDNADSYVKSDGVTSEDTLISYNKVLEIFTYRTDNALETTDVLKFVDLKGIVTPEGRKFKKYSEANGIFGASKINRPDVNAVPIGHWVTFKICSNINLAMRDLDFSRPAEEAIHKMKRGFYPLQEAKDSNRLPESTVINAGISKSLGDKYYFEIPDVPFIKTNFSNRIHYSDILQESSFKNGNRVFKNQNYQDYTREHGALVKLVEWYGTLIAVMEHGVLMIPVNERAMMTNAQGEDVYINTENILPKNPKVLSNSFGSTWIDSIVKTPQFIYGIDTVGKKIWRTNGTKFELISDLKIQKFLNDNIGLRVNDKDRSGGQYSIKSHYNAFKYDVMFVFVYGEESWNLCWNEMLNKWITQYTWFPEYSENINNIFYTFANESKHTNKGNILYKHGFAGNEEQTGIIKPTMWYDSQKLFEFEFVVAAVPGVQKIFDNLKIISNLTAPSSFTYEIVGEGYAWNDQKSLIWNLNDFNLTTVDNVVMPVRNILDSDKQYLEKRYLAYLIASPDTKKIPFIWVRSKEGSTWPETSDVSKDITIEQSNKTKEKLVTSYQKGMSIKDYKRIKGNMHYVEDSWDIQIQPISFKWAYLKNGGLAYSEFTDMKIRDKYIKIRVKYAGDEYAIINSLRTFFTLSHS